MLYVDHEILKRYPYTWHLPRSFRNYVAHEYFGINLKQVYKTAKEVLPDLKFDRKNNYSREELTMPTLYFKCTKPSPCGEVSPISAEQRFV